MWDYKRIFQHREVTFEVLVEDRLKFHHASLYVWKTHYSTFLLWYLYTKASTYTLLIISLNLLAKLLPVRYENFSYERPLVVVSRQHLHQRLQLMRLHQDFFHFSTNINSCRPTLCTVTFIQSQFLAPAPVSFAMFLNLSHPCPCGIAHAALRVRMNIPLEQLPLCM